MNHDTKLRDLERAFHADPRQSSLGEKYFNALARQGHIPHESFEAPTLPVLWRDCIVFQPHKENNEDPSTNKIYQGLHRSGRPVTITARRRLDTDNHADIAELKQLAEFSRQSFPKIVTPIDCGQTEENYYLVNEDLLSSQALSAALVSNWPLSRLSEEIGGLAKSVATILSFDCCPSAFLPSRNLFVNSKNQMELRISGTNIFDAMRASAILESFRGLALMPQLPGWELDILCYQSPEHVLEEEPDERSRVFQFGVLLYELLTGSRPFSGSEVIDIVRAVMRSQPPAPTLIRNDLPKAVSDVCMTALEKDPEHRYKSLRTFSKALIQATVAST